MSEEMQQDAVECASFAIENYYAESEIVALVKRETVGDQATVIKDMDMSEEMQQRAVKCASLSSEEHNVECDIAACIKRISVCL